MFNATFNNISVISWHSVLLVEETEYWPVASNWQTLSHNVVLSTPRLSGVQTLISGDRHWLYMYLEIQPPYDHDGPLQRFLKEPQIGSDKMA
jgi:hypothetical protein